MERKRTRLSVVKPISKTLEPECLFTDEECQVSPKTMKLIRYGEEQERWGRMLKREARKNNKGR
jgi:hypothetical protein